MPGNRLNYVVVGSFVLLMLAGLLVALALLTGRTGGSERYFTHYPRVPGIKYGTPILFAGYPVGQVSRIEPLHDAEGFRFRVELAIERGWPIPVDSVAQVRASGLLGVVSIDIAQGESDVLLSPGEALPGRAAPDLFASVAGIAGVVGDIADRDLRPLLRNVNLLVESLNEIASGDAPAIVSDLRSVSGRLDTGSERIVGDLVAVSGSIRASVDRLSTLLGDGNIARADRVVANVDEAAANFALLAGDLRGTREELDRLLVNLNAVVADNKIDIDRTVMDLRYSMHAVSQRIDAVAGNLEGTSRNMYEFTRQLRQNPGSILGGAKVPDDNR